MRRLRSILDFALAALSLWAAWYHTPAGALLRVVSAHVFGLRTAARPLLGYYVAGTQGAQLPESIVPRPTLSPRAALGAGAAAVLGHLAPAERERILARANARSATPDELSSAIGRLATRHGSREAGVLALFCGSDAAQFAVGRAAKGASLEDLARELPPSYERSISLAGETVKVIPPEGVVVGAAVAATVGVPVAAGVTVAVEPEAVGVRVGVAVKVGVQVGPGVSDE